MHPRFTAALVVFSLGCAGASREDVAPLALASDAGALDRDIAPPPVESDAAVSPDVAPITDAPPTATAPTTADACDFRAEVEVRLRATRIDRNPRVRLPAGTRLDLLAVSTVARGTRAAPAILSRVRVRESGQEGWVYLHAEAVGRCQESQRTSPDIYETHQVRVGGVDETWSLRVVRPLHLPDVAESEMTCEDRFERDTEPVDLVLERRREGVLVESVHELHAAEEEVTRLRAPRSPWPGLVRPTVLDVGDYNHDGEATEFAMDTAFLACTQRMSGVFGVSSANARMHQLRDARGVELGVSRGAWFWDAVRAQRSGDRVEWTCGDHGATEDEHYRWTTTRDGFVQQTVLVPMREDCAAPVDESGREE